MGVGGLLASLSFVIAGLLQLQVNKTMEVRPPANQAFLQVYHNTDCKFIDNMEPNQWTKLTLNASLLNVEPKEACNFNAPLAANMSVDGRGYFLGAYSANNQSGAESFSYDVKKTGEGKTRVYILADPTIFKDNYLYAFDDNNELRKDAPLKTGSYLDVKPKVWGSPVYTLRIGKDCATRDADHQCDKVGELDAKMGAAHVMLFWQEDGKVKNSPLQQIVRENSVSLLWQLPQFLCITTGEVLFSVTGLEFSYSQAAPNMKSVLQAMWLMTVALGNVIDMGISGTHIIKEPATEFFVYAALMFSVMLIFIVLAMRYKYVDPKALVSPTESPQHELPALTIADANGHVSDEKVRNGSNGRIAD
uniref:Uncharacterized protein n=1 Tax=Plectus sambesii TaxID=2011161 RepID=A0A914V5Q8_9BILA